jgi:hypothetical protein
MKCGSRQARPMGEARRRRRSKPAEIEIEGPTSYEIGAYRLDDILAGSLMALFDRAPSAQALALMRATAELAERMGDRSLPTMLCAFCDHEFAHGDQPTEVMVALPWANPKHPPIVSPICGACAAASEDVKTGMVKASWSKLSPGSRFDGPGHA